MLTYAGVYCEGQCNCHACHNNPRFEMDRQAAIGVTLGMCVCGWYVCVCGQIHSCREESDCLPPQSAIHFTTDVNAAYTVAERNPLAFRPKVQSTAATTQAVNAQTQEPSSLSARHMKVKKGGG